MNLRGILIATLTFTALCAIFLPKNLQAQNVLYGPYEFDDPNLGNWIRNTDLVNWTPDGTAAFFDDFWDGRDRIASTSLGGAAVFFREDPNGLTMRSRQELNLDFTGEDNVFLSFHQYYRAFTSSTELRVYENSTELLETYSLNSIVGGNVETDAADTVIIDLSEVVANKDSIQIEFFQNGRNYFWLLDDVTFYDGDPYPRSLPDTIGDYLHNNGYPFEVFPYDDDNGIGATPYVPYELVVKFIEGTPEAQRIPVREEFGAVLLDSCACGKLELWEIDGSNFFDPMGQQSAQGGTNSILTNKDGAGEKPIIDTVDLNYYNGVLLNVGPTVPNAPLTDSDIMGLQSSNPDAYKISILDTGVDYQHPDIRDFVRVKESTPCLDADILGWNYEDKNNNPFDDNGHGTHVAGIIADTLSAYNTICDYEFIPFKTHDRNGVSTLFKVSCATYQSVLDSVDFINDSWGFFGQPSPILRGAMDTAAFNNILIITAAGNDGLNLNNQKQYPACYAYNGMDSIVTVGATAGFAKDPETGDLFPARAFFSNFSPIHVDIMAPGFEIESAAPSWQTMPTIVRSGTSMATPMVTAGAAIAYCCNQNDADLDNDLVWAARDTVLERWAIEYTGLSGEVNLGRFLQITPDPACIVNVDEVIEILDGQNGFFAFPNPVRESLWLRSQENRTPAQVDLINAQGQIVRRWQSDQWYQDESLGLDLVGIPTGVYFLRVLGADYQWTGKIMKQ
ncbi:MAG: S8 family peptidase [Bacteroidota bacterium]